MRADERVCLHLVAGGDDIDEGIEIIGESLHRPGGEGSRTGQHVEALQHPQRQPVVEMVAVSAQLAVADDGVDLAVDGAVHELVGDNRRGGEESGAPGIVERPALGGGAHRIGALPAHPRSACRSGNRAGGGQCLQEGADARPRPSIDALRAALAPVTTAGEGGAADEVAGELGNGEVCDHEDRMFSICSTCRCSRSSPIIQDYFQGSFDGSRVGPGSHRLTWGEHGIKAASRSSLAHRLRSPATAWRFARADKKA